MNFKIFCSLIVVLAFSHNLIAQVIIKEADFAKRQIPDTFQSKTENTVNYEPPVNMSLIGQMTYGQTFAINSKDSIIYFSEDRWVVVADYSNPSKPKILSRIRVPNVIGRIRRVDNYLYVVTKYHKEFSIIDISDPNNPINLGGYDSGTYDIAIYGNYAYTAHDAQGMHILDISNPENVTKIKRLNSLEDVNFLFIAGGYLYRNYGYNLEILSLADPLNPRKISSIPTGYDKVRDIIIEGNFVYCCIRDMGLWVIDVTDKYNPSIISKYKGDWHFFNRIAKKNSRIYASTYASGLSILDYSNIKEPKEVGKIDQLEHIYTVHINKDNLYVGDTVDGMYAFDISNPDTIELLHNVKTFAYLLDVAIRDSVAFLADTRFGIRVVDISNPQVPIELSWFRTPGKQYAVFVKDNYLFVSDDTEGLRIFNIANVDSIEEVSLITGYQTISCTVQNNFLYLSARKKGVRIFDISDIYNPVEIGHYVAEHNSGIDQTIIKEPYAYLLNYGFSCIIIDISDKSNPKFVNEILPYNFIISMAVHDNFVYLGNSDDGVRIIDISDPKNAIEVGKYDKGESFMSIIANAQYAYYSLGHWGLKVLDIQDPGNPVVCASYYTDSFPQNFLVKNDTIYVPDSYDGLYILKHDQTTTINEITNTTPVNFFLEQNYPNPFNSLTNIQYQLARPSEVELTIYNLLGQKVSALVNDFQKPGSYFLQWDGSNVASGIYFYRLTVSNQKGTFNEIKKCILLK